VKHKLTSRETVQVIAALRFWGQTASTAGFHPSQHPLCRDRFKRFKPMTLDELETLIGRLDGSYEGPGLRPWEPRKYL